MSIDDLHSLPSLPCPGEPGPEMTDVISQSKRGALIRPELSVFSAQCPLPKSFQAPPPTPRGWPCCTGRPLHPALGDLPNRDLARVFRPGGSYPRSDLGCIAVAQRRRIIRQAASRTAGGGHIWRSGAAGRYGLCCFWGWLRPAGEAAEGSGAKGWQNHDRYGSLGVVCGTWRGFMWRGRRLPTDDPASPFFPISEI